MHTAIDVEGVNDSNNNLIIVMHSLHNVAQLRTIAKIQVLNKNNSNKHKLQHQQKD